MASSLSLHFKQWQSLAMSPQLMRLIRMNHLELCQFIAQEIKKNPLLEVQSADEAAAADHEDASPHPAEAGSEIDDWMVDSAMLRYGERLNDASTPTSPMSSPTIRRRSGRMRPSSSASRSRSRVRATARVTISRISLPAARH